MDQSIVSSIFSSRAESGRYNVETRKENMHEHTGASHAAAFCLDEAENNTSTTHLEDISKKTKNYISAFKKASVLVQYCAACMRACAKHGVRGSTSFKNHCATRVVWFVCDHGLSSWQTKLKFFDLQIAIASLSWLQISWNFAGGMKMPSWIDWYHFRRVSLKNII